MKKRNFNIDLIKCLGILSVLIIHSIPTRHKNKIGVPYHILQAVPLFILISAQNYMTSSNLGYRNFFSKIKRILVPYILIFLIQVALISLWKGNIHFNDIFVNFISGGYGPGGYYVPLMLQVVIIFPFIFLLVRHYPKITLASVFLFTIVYEYMAYLEVINNSMYRVFVFRYLFLVVIGVYIYYYGVKRNKKVFFLTILSVIYIFMVEYLNFNFYTNKSWRSQNIYAFFYPVMLYLFLIDLKLNINVKLKKWIELVSKSSYHIYLVQTVFFLIIYYKFPNTSWKLLLIIALISNVLLGVVFYELGGYVKKWKLSYISNKK